MKAAEEARKDFRNRLLSTQGRESVDKLISHQLFGRTPAIFGDDQAAWIDWKAELAAGLEVDPLSIFIVGSAALGFSPSIGKDMHLFQSSSDIDVAVISPHHFDLAWHELRSFDRSRFPATTCETLSKHDLKYIYWGTVATDEVLMCFDFGKKWSARLDKMRDRPPTVDRDVNVRLYRDPASLRTYQIKGLLEARSELLLQGASF